MMAANPTRKLAAQCTAEQSERLPQLVCVAVVCRQFPSVAVKTTIVRRIEAFVDVAAGCSLQDACAKSLWLAKRVVALNEWTSGHDDEWRRESAIEALGAAAGCGKLKLVQWLCAEAETIAGVDAVVVVRGKYADRRWTAMHGAAMHGHLDVVKWLVAQGARVDEKDDGNMTPLRFACCWGHLSVAQWLFDKGARLDTLHGAARTGCLPVAQWLLDNGASVNEKDRSAGTPLHSAVYSISGTQSERFAIVEWLVNQGARVNAKDDFGCTVLHNVHEGDSVVEFLIDHGAAVNEKCESGETALHGAALRGYFSIVRLLVSKGARVDEKDNAGRTALHNAAYGGHLNLVQWLVDQGAHVDEQDTNGSTALHGAARLQDPSVMVWLVENGANADKRTHDGQTALHLATSRGRLLNISWLLSVGATAFAPDKRGDTAFYYATVNDHPGTVKLFLELCSDSESAPDSELLCALFKAASNDWIEIFKLLVDLGVDPLHIDSRGRTSLHEAVAASAINIVHYLLSCGANVCHADKLGTTPVLDAARGGNLEIFCWLLAAGASVGDCDYIGQIALHHAARRGHTAVLHEILAYGASINSCDQRGWTPLHCSAAAGHKACTELLINKGIDLSAKTVDGKTALVLALERGHVATSQHLMECGADTTSILRPGPNSGYKRSSVLLSDRHSGIVSNWDISQTACFLDPDDVCFDGTIFNSVDGTWLGAPVEVKERRKHDRMNNFVEELHRWSALSHPHIVKLYGACQSSEPFFVFERATKEKLSKIIRNDNYEANVEVITGTLYQVAMGLQYLHDRDIIHGALDCDSIALSTNGTAKLRNFGLGGVDRFWPEQWTAPEVLLGFPQSIESDVFAFGMTIVEAVKGTAPWYHLQNGACRTAVVAGRLPDKPDNMTSGLWHLVERMLSWHPRDRPTMSLVVRELEVLTQEIEDKEPNLYQPGQSIRALQSWRALGEYHVEKMTIFELLCELEQMCEDSSVKSVNDMNRNAYNRLMDIFKQLTVRSDTPTRNLVEQYKRILLEFRASLMRSAAAGSSEIAQFAASRQGAENNFLIHGRIDRFVTAACLSNTTGNPDWREQWESQRVQQQHEFMKKLDVDSMASLLEDIADEKERDDAQTLVSFELSKNAKTCATYLSTSFTGAKSTLSALATMKDVDWFIPEYEVEFDAFHEFSSGAFGSVHHGKWKHAEVVVKKVKLGSSSDAAAFVNEVKIWHKLRHPYVIQLFGACHTKQPFFVCEFAPNGQLDHYLKTNGGDVWKKLYEAALGLQYLHWMGVIHGDLKCNNILVGGDGATKLADFGLSSLSSSIILIEPESEIDSGDKPRPVGAIRWKAPEMLKGEKGTLASDVYSFGMCIIEAVSGEYPWGMRLPDVAVKYHVLHKTLPKRPAMIDGDAWSLVEQMCRYAPEDRMGIRQVVEALQNKC